MVVQASDKGHPLSNRRGQSRYRGPSQWSCLVPVVHAMSVDAVLGSVGHPCCSPPPFGGNISEQREGVGPHRDEKKDPAAFPVQERQHAARSTNNTRQDEECLAEP
jgi:hypothetical protein